MAITIKVNGEERSLDRIMNISSLMELLEVSSKGVVVERNGEILDRELYEQVMVKDGDQLELVRLVGGG